MKQPIHARAASESGQTIIFMIMALIILSFVLLWNFDIHTILHLKSRTQNAGDAAAVAAARWQGYSLNLIGDLNIMQAVVLSGGDTNTADRIAAIRARLCYVGPMIALAASQQAAKQNGIYVNESFTSRTISNAYAILNDYPLVFPEPYAGCWNEYGTMLLTIALQGVAAAPDNAHFYFDYAGTHILLGMDFYDAVAGRDWCWFRWHDMTLLETYTDYLWWPDLPPQIPESHPSNSEFFRLGLQALTTTLPGGVNTVALMNQLATQRNLSTTVISNSVAEATCVWHAYNPSVWSRWEAISLTGADPFPAAGPVQPQFDYAGADAAIRIEAEATRLTPNAPSSHIIWTAAAKPFGYLEAASRPNDYTVVLPAFHSIRLIPVDASSAPEGGAYNIAWREHIEAHLPLYMESGPTALDSSCFYCRQLLTWEDADFRQQGLDWLSATNAAGQLMHTCEGPGSGPYAGGGRRRGH